MQNVQLFRDFCRYYVKLFLNDPLMTDPLKSIIKDLDQALAAIPSICRKGCAFCCYQAATVAEYEEAAIQTFIKKRLSMKMKSTVRQRAMVWLEQYENIYDQIDAAEIELAVGSAEAAGYAMYQEASSKLSQTQTACPFLVNSQCSIYPVRPLSCRIHGQVADLEACQSDLLRVNSDLFKETAERYFQKIKDALMGSGLRQPVVRHRHLVPAVKQDLMINLPMRHAPMLHIQL